MNTSRLSGWQMHAEGIAFDCETHGKTYPIIAPRELLDDEIGEDWTFERACPWLERHVGNISMACVSGQAMAPFDRLKIGA